jgi:hypothetical protein
MRTRPGSVLLPASVAVVAADESRSPKADEHGLVIFPVGRAWVGCADAPPLAPVTSDDPRRRSFSGLTKTHDVKPPYPPQVQAAKVSGLVVTEATPRNDWLRQALPFFADRRRRQRRIQDGPMRFPSRSPRYRPSCSGASRPSCWAARLSSSRRRSRCRSRSSDGERVPVSRAASTTAVRPRL